MKNIKDMILKNGGATLDSNLEPIQAQNGYMVSMQGHELVTTIEGLNDTLIERYTSLAKKLNGYVGMWLDDGKVYLDISQHHTNKNKALEIGKANKQLAIYDIGTGKEIRL